jgi:hypothetical protein
LTAVCAADPVRIFLSRLPRFFEIDGVHDGKASHRPALPRAEPHAELYRSCDAAPKVSTCTRRTSPSACRRTRATSSWTRASPGPSQRGDAELGILRFAMTQTERCVTH